MSINWSKLICFINITKVLGGGSCTYKSYDGTETKYAACDCPGYYIYTSANCNGDNEPSGTPCIGNDGVARYPNCGCAVTGGNFCGYDETCYGTVKCNGSCDGTCSNCSGETSCPAGSVATGSCTTPDGTTLYQCAGTCSNSTYPHGDNRTHCGPGLMYGGNSCTDPTDGEVYSECVDPCAYLKSHGTTTPPQSWETCSSGVCETDGKTYYYNCTEDNCKKDKAECGGCTVDAKINPIAGGGYDLINPKVTGCSKIQMGTRGTSFI